MFEGQNVVNDNNFTTINLILFMTQFIVKN